MPLVKIKPGLSHAHYSAGDVFDATPAEMEAFGDKFVLVVEPEPSPPLSISTVEIDVDATPGARRLAQEHNVSLAWSSIVGSGKDGKITKADVQRLLNGNAE